jgi:hypothetical protein
MPRNNSSTKSSLVAALSLNLVDSSPDSRPASWNQPLKIRIIFTTSTFTSETEFLSLDGILPRQLFIGHPCCLEILYAGLKHWEIPLLVPIAAIGS